MKMVRPATPKHPAPNASPEAMIEERLERVRARANLLRAERALFDCLAALLAAFFAGFILGRLFPGARFVPAVLALLTVAFAAMRIAAAARRWTGRDAAAALVDGEMNLKQRLVTFREYAALRDRPRLFDRLAEDMGQ